MIAALHISLDKINGKTRLLNAYAKSPFKIADITDSSSEDERTLVIMNASPGILDGDDYHIRVELETSARLRLQTQAYQRIFNMKRSAGQLMEVHLKNNASFIFLPHPTVPHKNAHFTCRNHFYLDTQHHLIFGEVLTCGRKHNGESFLFSKYHSHTRIYINQQIVISENLLMEPGRINPLSIGQLEGYSHQASMIILHPLLDIKDIQTALLNLFSQEKEIAFGITMAPVNGLLIRLLGQGAEQLHRLLIQAEQLVRLQTTEKPVVLAP
jgi:urease accessory protein